MGLAGFFVIHLVLGSAVSLITPLLARAVRRTSAATAANLLLAARLFPPVVSLLLMVFVCVPTYLWLERAEKPEHVGIMFLGAALLAAAAFALSLSRGLLVALESRRYVRDCERVGRFVRLSKRHAPLLLIEDSSPLFLVAGVFHPRLVISRAVVDVLSREQLEVAIHHERAHQTARDNLKRLLILLAPGCAPFARGYRCLEREWGKLIEWAADDQAAAGDSRRSVALADALVRFTRAGTCVQLNPLMISLTTGNDDLRTRVDRLLRESPASRGGSRPSRLVLAAALLSLIILACGLIAQPKSLRTVYALLERFHSMDVVSGRF